MTSTASICRFTVRTIALVFLVLFLVERAWTAPFGQWFPGTSPNGVAVRVWGWGDEYSVRYEAEDGHAVVRDALRGAYFYARQDASGALVSTGIAVGDETAADRATLATIPLHQADVSAAARERRLARIRRDDEETGRAARWARLKESARNARNAKKNGILMAPPSSPTLGTVKGLTILIDFPISGSSATTWSSVHPGVTVAQLKSLLNDTNCKLYGNYSSVHDYYYDVSNGKLDYSMAVIGPILAPYPRSHYDISTRDNGECARDLIQDVLSIVWNDAKFSTEYLPILQSLSTQDGDVRSLNFWFAGESATEWSKGLWAHKWWVGSTIYSNYKFTVGNKTMRFFNYQITPITSTPGVYTFCHENGHMLCGFPDLYSYTTIDNLGVGYFSLMYGSADPLNPPYIDPYLRAAAGWIEPKDLPASGTVTVRNNHTDVWKYENPLNSKEYYLIENRQQSGRDASIRASGILIWRCNEDGNNEEPQNLTGFGSNVHRLSNELSIEQADGDYDIEQAVNTGDRWDSWYAGNSYSDNVFNDTSLPTAKWSDASASKLSLRDFSANGETMTFVVSGGGGVTAPTITGYGGYTTYTYIRWNAVAGATGYRVYRSTNSGSRPTSYVAVASSQTAYSDYNATPGVTYYYWLSAVGSAGESVSGPISTYRRADFTTLSPTSLSFDGSGGILSVSVGANTSWQATKPTTATWLTLSKSGTDGAGMLNVTAAANTTSSARSTTVTLTAASGTAHPVTHTISVSQSAASTISLATVLDNTKLTFTTGGSASWFGQKTVTHDGVDAARSGSITHNQNTWMQTTVTGPGIISFWWYASSQGVSSDYLEFAVNGVSKGKIGGTAAAWTKCSYSLGSGSHALKWTYKKNSSTSSGLDAGFVDQVEWTDNVVTDVADLGIGFVSGGKIYALTLKGGRQVAFYDSWLTDAGIPISGEITASLLNAMGRNGLPRYQSYLFGLEPESSVPAEEQLQPTITFDANGMPIISCVPKMDNDLVTYTTLGKTSLNSPEWVKVTDSNRAQMKFFKVKVELAK